MGSVAELRLQAALNEQNELYLTVTKRCLNVAAELAVVRAQLEAATKKVAELERAEKK